MVKRARPGQVRHQLGIHRVIGRHGGRVVLLHLFARERDARRDRQRRDHHEPRGEAVLAEVVLARQRDPVDARGHGLAVLKRTFEQRSGAA